MTKIKTDAAQGDLYARKIRALPTGLVRREPDSGRHVVAHSETGHHHYLMAAGVECWDDPKDPLICYLQIASEATLTHARSWDTHAPITLGKGVWEIRRQEEMTPEGWRQVQD